MSDALIAENESLKKEIVFLKEQIAQLRKMLFGQKSERFIGPNPNVIPLPGLEDYDQEVGSQESESYKVPAHERRKAASTPKNTIDYPDDLPVETHILDLKDEDKVDVVTGLPLIKIGEEVSKRLALKPSQFFIKKTIRYKYASSKNPDAGIKIAELPDSIIARPACDESFIADVIVKKFCDHLPLYRQSEIFTRQKVYVSRQTLSSYVSKVASALTPLYELMQKEILASSNIFMDETPVQELAPGKGKTDQGYMVVVAGGKDLNPKNRFYVYFPDRKHQNFKSSLKDYQGVLHSDKYGAYASLALEEGLIWCPCWAHIRRKFIEAEGAPPALRTSILGIIQELFKIEDEISTLPEQQRLVARQSESLPKIDALLKLATDHVAKVLPKSKIGQALSYFLGLNPYIKNYVYHATARMDNNVAERALRPVAIGRKNWLFMGSEEGGQNTAILLTFAQSCKALTINPWEYFEDVIRRFQSHPFNKLDELLPENWAKARATITV